MNLYNYQNKSWLEKNGREKQLRPVDGKWVEDSVGR